MEINIYELTAEEQAFLPSEEDVAFYRKHGWYISKKIYSDEEIDKAIWGSERHYAGERDAKLPVPLKPFEDWTQEQGDCLRINDYIVQLNVQIHELAMKPILGSIASRLSGSDQMRLFHSSLLYKPPDNNPARTTIGWHYDRAYWVTCTSDDMLTAWIPLHDCDESMGTITMIDGSHLWAKDESPDRLHSHFVNSDVKELDRRLISKSRGKPIHKIPMNLKKGQVSFHHCLTFHGSAQNQSSNPRIAIALHLQDRNNRYRVHKLKNGKVHVYNNDLMCRKLDDGSPDYADPVFCPVIWEGNPL
ncbi:MAG: phytanoyl-CoA dioxygenase family protein [Rhizonema sp. PD37]|nr:phytanoyl-CoA dioxygenase family protein [Rhizonema sp. PD37]